MAAGTGPVREYRNAAKRITDFAIANIQEMVVLALCRICLGRDNTTAYDGKRPWSIEWVSTLFRLWSVRDIDRRAFGVWHAMALPTTHSQISSLATLAKRRPPLHRMRLRLTGSAM